MRLSLRQESLHALRESAPMCRYLLAELRWLHGECVASRSEHRGLPFAGRTRLQVLPEGQQGTRGRRRAVPGARSRYVPHDQWSDGRRHSGWKQTPHMRSEAEHAVRRRGCRDIWFGSEAVPPERFLPAAPLHLEAVRPRVQVAATKIESSNSLADRPFHARPV